MRLKMARFVALVFTALALGAALAHLYELPNKITLSREDYLTVQQIYRGWALLGIIEFASLFSVLTLAIMVRKSPKLFIWTLIATGCVAATLVVFFAFTYPANQDTSNWTILPENWQELRVQWEYSHATRAVLHLIAFVTLVLSILTKDE